MDLVWLGQARDSCYHLLMVSFLPQAPLCNGSMVWSVDLRAGGVRSLGFRDVVAAGGLGFFPLFLLLGLCKQHSEQDMPGLSGFERLRQEDYHKEYYYIGSSRLAWAAE